MASGVRHGASGIGQRASGIGNPYRAFLQLCRLKVMQSCSLKVMRSCIHAVLQSGKLRTSQPHDCTTIRPHDCILKKRALSQALIYLILFFRCAFAPFDHRSLGEGGLRHFSAERLIPKRTLERLGIAVPLAAATPWRRWIGSHHNQWYTIIEHDLLNNRGNIFLLKHGWI